MRTARVGPFWVFDGDREQLLTEYRHVISSRDQHNAVCVFHAHVSAVTHRRDDDFVAAMRAADIVYADGNSVALLARLGGATAIRRAVTTDVGWDFLRVTAECLGRPLRLAVVGGGIDRATAAAAVFDQHSHIEVAYATHGFHADWEPVWQGLRDSSADVLLLGLGTPREMVLAAEHSSAFGGLIILTCGGWFGYLAGDERRAPSWMRRVGLEWFFRISQDPRRLAPRYFAGFVATMALAIHQIRSRHLPSATDPHLRNDL